MLSRRPIGARLGIAFGTLVLLLVSASALALYGLGTLRDSAEALDRNARLALNADQVRLLALEERRFEKDMFINLRDTAKVQSYKDRWDATLQKLQEALQAGRGQAPDAELAKLYETSAAALGGYAKGLEVVYLRLRAGEFADTAAANSAMGQYKNEIYQLDEAAAAIDHQAAEHMAQARQQVAERLNSALVSLLGFAALALLIAVLMALYITRSITGPLQRALAATRRVAEGDLTQDLAGHAHDETGQLLNAMDEANRKLSDLVGSLHNGSESVYRRAREVFHGSQELAARTEEQASALQQTAASMEQISATARQTSEATEQANRLAATAARTAQSGGQDVERSILLMRELADSSQKINDIIGVIDSIAFQTNLLALNASVEAARAGEQGRGFAVVAAEVRNLASRSATSAQEIRGLIEAIGEKIGEGARQAEYSGRSIRDAVEAIHQLAGLMEEISAATREQRSGFGQINGAIGQLDGTTQQNAALVEQSRAAAAALEEQAALMQQRVAVFRTRETAADDALALA
ncbi:HAMP domain-containing protein [Azotobacter chroococcum subsp. isscasi]|uniref:methyl-accepting chemotaxis protein n=1 Tax=Azotobacter chroococcum TaxID=353 RepID=UPI00103D9B6B|nr:methyl-accepting chemotaxis protein [Azotobacter chroococcum]TBW13266.1 HAMP domain-containing protein [Azotobacter chroococcum subsp. isscasi]